MSLLKITALGVAGLASLALAPSSQAAVINYAFQNASYGGNGDSANLSGTFSWDTTSNSVTASNINLTGVDAGSNVSCTNCSTNFYNPEHFAINLGPQALYLTFGSSLSNGGTVNLSLRAPTEGNQPEYQGRSAFTTVSGAAVQVAAVPEPATWGMMIMGFGLMGAGLRSRKTKVAFA
ncbi:MAG: PEPxxWA-CTERM sorting domain-containing protein [Sphingomonas sp.]|uniref:PEPxxWA-CTERM sorting domain-containing protein n=1 Tax=Sphingomonas sp. TaxID=28214 RepID=UPI001AC22AD1|nr:PEPxxWA-CTERM sorting domain-containing protein [Sphingomonas sp.]MBN8808581.1 PEPxxWA-CTERM sorting domain-containing protein [Sphingomonas sp.]